MAVHNCPRCGAEFPQDSRKCAECGYISQSRKSKKRARRRKIRRIIIGSISVLILIIALVAVWMLFDSIKPKDMQDVPEVVDSASVKVTQGATATQVVTATPEMDASPEPTTFANAQGRQEYDFFNASLKDPFESIYESEYYTYRLKENGTVVITAFDSDTYGEIHGVDSDVFIPNQIDGYTVSEIGPEAFENAWIESVITLPNTITTIAESAFSFSKFTSVNIPSSVEQIKESAFLNMHYNEKFIVDARNPVYATIDGVLYNKQTKMLVACPRNVSGWSCVVPEGILSIGRNAFEDVDVRVELPSTLMEIGDFAFTDGTQKYFEIPNSVEVIGCGAFRNNEMYMMRDETREYGLYLPNSVKQIGTYAFSDCKGYLFANEEKNYHYIDLSDTQLTEIPEGAFSGVRSHVVDEVLLPESLISIGERAFVGVNVGDSEGLIIPSSVEIIDANAFVGGSGRVSFSQNSNLKSIGERAFYGFEFKNMEKVIILPEGVESIGANAFDGIEGIERIRIPNSVTAIGDNLCNRADIILEVGPGSYAEHWASENGYLTNWGTSQDTSWLND